MTAPTRIYIGIQRKKLKDIWEKTWYKLVWQDDFNIDGPRWDNLNIDANDLAIETSILYTKAKIYFVKIQYCIRSYKENYEYRHYTSGKNNLW